MSQTVAPLLEWLNANPHLAGLATFVISAAESVAVIGTIVPGTITMTAIGTLAGAGVIPLWSTLIWAMLGAVVGDGISYWVGHHYKEGLRKVWPFKSNPDLLISGEKFVTKYGVMSVFIGRFVGPVRALVPLVAGMLGMKPVQFYIANITSAIGWAPAYMLPGILLGAASMELPPDIAIHVILVLFLILLFITLIVWLAYKILQLARKQIEQFLNRLWKRLEHAKYLHATTIILKHHDRSQHHGQLTLAFYFIVSSCLLLLLCAYVSAKGASHMASNNVIYHLFRGMRNPTLDNIVLSITILGQKRVLFPLIIAVSGWLWFINRKRASIHALLLLVITSISVYGLKHLIQSPRPSGIFHSPESYSMPSGHTTASATVYITFAILIAASISKRFRWLVMIPTIILTIIIGLSRVYLSAHWFTDIIAAWLLSTSLIIFVVLSYNRRKEAKVPVKGVLLTAFLTLACTFSIYHYRYFDQMKTDFAMVEPPALNVSMDEWWASGTTIPTFRVSLFGFPSQPISITWAGKLEDIKKTLLKSGWETPPERDLINTMHRVADVESTSYLPLISPQYMDKKPRLILIKRAREEKRDLIVLRLYDSKRAIKENNTALWVGNIGRVPRSYSWIFHKHKSLTITPKEVFNNTSNIHAWEWKLITYGTGDDKQRKPMLLIRKK